MVHGSFEKVVNHRLKYIYQVDINVIKLGWSLFVEKCFSAKFIKWRTNVKITWPNTTSPNNFETIMKKKFINVNFLQLNAWFQTKWRTRL